MASVAFLPILAAAQEERPQIMPGERKPTSKKDPSPRAIALLQLTANGKASLVPIAILIDGKFWDAGAYRADPVPMALDSGVVYEAERTGTSKGLFTVSSALHSNSPNAPTPWLGTGKWAPAGAAEPETSKKAEPAPVGIDNSDGPPRLTKNPQAVNPPPAKTAPAPTTPDSKSDSGDEPPRLKKPEAPSKPESKPPDTAANDSKPEGAKLPESDSGASQASRPRLRRGPAAEYVPEDDIPGYSRPGVKPSTTTTTQAATIGPIQYFPAISDAGGPTPRPYTFEWLTGEEDQRRQQMLALAKERLHAYLVAQAKARITPKPATAKPPRAAKAVEPVIENPQMIAYDLWGNNVPVILLAADAHQPPASGAASGSVDPTLQYSILLIAYPDLYNNLHTLYVGITDKYHLDITPRLELIDAVDADGDGRGELLFRKISDAGAGWILYRATADKLWKVYDSLNPE